METLPLSGPLRLSLAQLGLLLSEPGEGARLPTALLKTTMRVADLEVGDVAWVSAAALHVSRTGIGILLRLASIGWQSTPELTLRVQREQHGMRIWVRRTKAEHRWPVTVFEHDDTHAVGEPVVTVIEGSIRYVRLPRVFLLLRITDDFPIGSEGFVKPSALLVDSATEHCFLDSHALVCCLPGSVRPFSLRIEHRLDGYHVFARMDHPEHRWQPSHDDSDVFEGRSLRFMLPVTQLHILDS